MVATMRIADPISDCTGYAMKLFTTIPAATATNRSVVTGCPHDLPVRRSSGVWSARSEVSSDVGSEVGSEGELDGRLDADSRRRTNSAAAVRPKNSQSAKTT